MSLQHRFDEALAAAKGALKAAARPAPAPVAIKICRSRGVTLSHWATAAPTAPPICTVGPSRPRVSPLLMPSPPPTNFTGNTVCQRIERNHARTAFRCGMPLSAASGARLSRERPPV